MCGHALCSDGDLVMKSGIMAPLCRSLFSRVPGADHAPIPWPCRGGRFYLKKEAGLASSSVDIEVAWVLASLAWLVGELKILEYNVKTMTK